MLRSWRWRLIDHQRLGRYRIARLQRQGFDQPKEVRRFPRGVVEVVELEDTVVGRITYQPGWRWSVDMQPIAGTELCEYHHLGVALAGRLRVVSQDGLELELGPGDIFNIPPGHDAWVVGEESWVSVDFAAMRTFARGSPIHQEQVLASILFTDVVDSTSLAARLGPTSWQDLIAEHNQRAQRVIDRFRGRLVKTTGDGLLAQFDGSERAVRAGLGIGEAVKDLALVIRAGVHTGEVQSHSDDLRGLAVHVAARIMALAGPGEVLVSGTVRDLLEGSGIGFEDRGTPELRGIGARAVFVVSSY